MKYTVEQIERGWRRLGVGLRIEPAAREPDLERLLVQTFAAARENSRLADLVVTWLRRHGELVSVRRLTRLLREEGTREQRAVMGVLIETAVLRGSAKRLRGVLTACAELSPSRALFAVHERGAIGELRAERASEVSRKWGVWAPELEDRPELVRDRAWVLHHNARLRERSVRGGDLKCDVLETLALDLGGEAKSAAEIAMLTGATRAATRAAIESLVTEGVVQVAPSEVDPRRMRVVIARSAA